MKKKFNICIAKIIALYVSIPVIIAVCLYALLPRILNYPPESINNIFQKEVDGITYTQQYILLFSLILIFSLLTLFVRIYKIHKNISKLDNPKIKKNEITQILLKIRRYCYDTPYLLYVLEILLPLIFLPLIFIIINAYPITILKICLTYISFLTLSSVTSFVSAKREFGFILTLLNEKYPDTMEKIEQEASKKRSKIKSLTAKLVLQFIPLILVALIFLSLVGYVQASKKTGDLYYESYSKLFENQFENTTFYSEEDVKESLENIPLLNDLHDYFIVKSDGSYITSDNTELKPFFIKYILENSEEENGRTYDYYCLDTEGIVKKCYFTDGSYCYAGIKYDTSQPLFLEAILICDIALFIIIITVLLFVLNSLSNEIKTVASRLKDIAFSNEKAIDLNKNLIITSEDELADLSLAFNQTQIFTKNNIQQIRDNQSMLMERERLASLGQLIGGIAHNLKTPIMSISGAAEGLTDLIKEYDSSIDDPEVNSQDHHDIAKDMSTWVTKIKEYTEYMSDIITAVKGQAVTLSETEDMTFDVDELLKRVNILMKHELKNAIIYLNISIESDPNIKIHGDVNSLVQVINNMISNSIQAYNGETNKNIDLITKNDDKNLYIYVKDYGSGLSDEVKDKLFKEMVTTKGKNGTGLGLYMSYSTIKAHFGGDITFESKKGKGTTFIITLPL